MIGRVLSGIQIYTIYYRAEWNLVLKQDNIPGQDCLLLLTATYICAFAEHRPDFKTPVSRLSGNILQGATYQVGNYLLLKLSFFLLNFSLFIFSTRLTVSRHKNILMPHNFFAEI